MIARGEHAGSGRCRHRRHSSDAGGRTASAGGTSSRPAAPRPRPIFCMAPRPPRSSALPPRMAIGPLGLRRAARPAARARPRPARSRPAWQGRAAGASASSVSTSSGSATTTGPGRPGGRHREGAGDELGNAGRVVDLRPPIWRCRRRSAGSRPPGTPRARAMPRAIWPMNRISGVESCMAMWMPADALVAPGPRVTKQMPGLPVSRAVAVGHHRGAAFLAADDGADRRIVQRVEHGEIAFARHAIDAVDAVGLERLDDQLSAGLHSLSLLQFGKDFGGVLAEPRRGPLVGQRRLRHDASARAPRAGGCRGRRRGRCRMPRATVCGSANISADIVDRARRHAGRLQRG